jgi:hypothetical protein
MTEVGQGIEKISTSLHADSDKRVETPVHPDFFKQQGDYLKKHEDEVAPQNTGPFAFAIVKRAHMELRNGNVTALLKSLVTQQLPPGEVKGARNSS